MQVVSRTALAPATPAVYLGEKLYIRSVAMGLFIRDDAVRDMARRLAEAREVLRG